MIDEKKLKECPFCGGKAEIKEFANGHKRRWKNEYGAL